MTRRKILIVDDDQYVRVLLARMVEPLHHDVQSAENGQVALYLAIQTPFDLVLTDWKMPVMDGLTLIENLRARLIDSAIILLTAHADLDRVLEAGKRLNISSFLIKPIHSLEQLHFDIQAAISRRELERENRSLMLSLRDANTRLEERIAERTRELAKTNEELNHISQFRADVLKILGHELHTPLAILQGYLQLAASATGRESSAYLGQMEQSLVRLERIARKALLLDKVTGDSQFPITPERVSPAGLCRRVIDRLEPLIHSRQIQFELAMERPVPDCYWDSGRIEYIVEELLINAVRATPNGGTVRVQLDTGGDAVMIRVIDEGTGMTESEHQRVFEPFVTLGAPEHHTSGQFDFRAQGLGIGLPTARMLAELHGGSLVSVPNPSGRGCIFTLSLRQRPESTLAQPEARPAPFAGEPDRASEKPAAAP